MARLYANENFPMPVVEELRRLGHNVLTIQEAGKGGQSVSDEEVLSFASTDSRALLTLNRKHFIRLHKASPGHAGIIVCTFDPDYLRYALCAMRFALCAMPSALCPLRYALCPLRYALCLPRLPRR